MDGIINIYKPKEWTSHDIVAKIKKITGEKVGHTGTLDPLAQGVLPILIGKGTQCSKYLVNHDKKYRVELKLGKRTEQYSERGYSGVIRDGVRATMFIPEADKNYVKIVKEMQKKGYKIAKTFAEDSKGNIILDKNGVPKMVDDIDVRFGDNAVLSGYEDVQMRFEKNGNLYELLILPGPNYLATKNKEHELVYENFRKYDTFVKDDGAKEIIKAIKKEYHKLTRALYTEAKHRDVSGANKSEQITFTQESVDTVDKLFKSLKTLFLGKFNAQPPSKRSKPSFKQTKTYENLDAVEQKLRKVIDLYSPVD